VRAVVDTNVVAYYLLGTQPFADETRPFWQALEEAMAPALWEAELANVIWTDSQSGAREGRRLKDFGIDLSPYIPDGDHSFIDEVMAYVESRRGSSEAVNHRLSIVRKNLSAGRPLDAIIYLWHTCHADVSRSSDRRAIGDAVSEVFNRTLGVSNESTTALVRRCQEIGIDLAQLWQRTADLLVPSIKSVHGLRQSLRLIEAATAKRYPHLARRLAELEKQVAGPPPART
jgi:predicted nucleic acid-binding protein